MEQEKQQEIEKRLKDLRHELVDKRERLEDSRMNLKPQQVELVERAVNQQLAEGLDQLDERGEELIATINHALSRLKDGEYQRCESCGEFIGEKRLEALPWTNMCIACAEEAERGN